MIGSRVATERAVLLSASHSFIKVGSNGKVAMEFGTQVSTFGLTARICFPAFTVSFENDESDRCWQTSRSWLHVWKDTAFLFIEGKERKKKKKNPRWAVIVLCPERRRMNWICIRNPCTQLGSRGMYSSHKKTSLTFPVLESRRGNKVYNNIFFVLNKSSLMLKTIF